MIKKLFPALAVLAVACSPAPKNSYELTGAFKGELPEQVFLNKVVNNKFEAIDSAIVKEGQFKFAGKVTSPEMFYLTFGEQQNVPFFVENTAIEIAGHIDSLQNTVISGSASNDLHKKFQDSQQDWDKKIRAKYGEFTEVKASGDETLAEKLYAEVDSIYTASQEDIKAFVKSNTNSPVSAYIIRRNLIHSLDLAGLEELTNALNPELKDNIYVGQLMERINTLRNLEPGKEAPLFTQNDTAGNPVSLESFRGKYVLIDFWASWCGPCRRANPHVVELYKKYNSKGFEILGVSMDSDKNKWLQAIANDKLTWQHVSTLEGWNNPVAKPYGVNSIPHTILIDPYGKIVKRGLGHEELAEKLAEIFK
jgi:thiol-disulfide isomerase/thioredoxin